MRVSNPARYLAGIAFCVVIGALVVAITVSTTLRYRASDTAIAAWPWNAEARGALAGRLILSGNIAAAMPLARRAVRESPGDAMSLRALGLMEDVVGNKTQALRIMRLAARSSRRDLQTNIWFIEYYVSKNDINSAVRYYDYSLKTLSESEEILFPILVPAMENPVIARAVLAHLVERPIWTTSFLQYAFASGKADSQVIPIVVHLSRDKIGLSPDLKVQYAQRLAERGYFAGLVSLSQGLGHPIVNGPMSLDHLGTLPPIDWRLLSGPGLSTFAGARSGFNFVASQNGDLAQRILHLPPGTYALHATANPDLTVQGARLRWSMTCAADGRPIAIVTIDSADRLDIPLGSCGYQNLLLSVQSDQLSDGREISGSVKAMRIDRLK